MPSLTLVETQTDNLVRRLRQWLGDPCAWLYENNDVLTQRLYDNTALFETVTQTTVTYVDLSTQDPLDTDPDFTSGEREVFALLTAKLMLTQELTEAARSAAQLRSPAGSMDTRDVWKALQAALDEVNAALEGILGLINPPLVFVDLTTMDGRVAQAG
jgi:hypothetical protein